ncbi:unnamed protein product [Cryptosporidium hominis]|uniref:EF-hand domain-containing protein n=2 Tax=Cryptosporidium hominis TaxID=237895 RepID=A0A0S4TBW3_CRYHO|nr:putative integral membrane protein [Cryptosporidium hominis]PPA65753.1 COPI associated family protein [Cryptosporidium hominis]PPS95036.1 Uncharacterized protein GY17_00002153 [Cryptosporidium hominis]CUV04556.1 unnamed protein product [Cryptosporidium hominis]|eukprot:PPS95036.1 Uncharacterized protein GY17_00002153 [Cryptosporidium hominis]
MYETQGGISGERFIVGVKSSSKVDVTLADQIIIGGARVEKTLQDLNCRYQTLFFIGAGASSAAGVLAATNSLFNIQPANMINSLFQLLFGILLMILDVPGSPRWSARGRTLIRKEARFLTHLTGKSLCLLFLSCLTSTTLWPQRRGAGVLALLAFLTSVAVAGVAIIGLLISLQKSVRLERVRKNIITTKTSTVADVYRRYAIADPVYGMQFEEFSRMAADYTNGRQQFGVTDLSIIYNALDENQKSGINEREFSEWVNGSTVYL